MLRLDAHLLVGQVNVELHSCRKKHSRMWGEGRGSRPLPLVEQRGPVTAGFSPGAREQQALSVSGSVSRAGSAARSSLCVRSFGDGA